jgi:hypothetical protein
VSGMGDLLGGWGRSGRPGADRMGGCQSAF